MMQLSFKRYGNGPPLLILHGLLGSGSNWHTLSSRVFADHYEVFTPDLRNHGRSPHSDVFDYPTLAGDVRDFMQQQGLDRVHLLGHSMGGKVAMHVALLYPHLLDRLIVVDIAPKPYAPRHLEILDILGAIDPADYDTRQEIDAALARSIPSLPTRQLLLKNLDYDGTRYRWKMNLPAIIANYDAINKGLVVEGTFDQPTLFVRGETSDYVDDADEGLILRSFPNAQVVTIPGAGHWVHADAPQPFAAAVLAFLSQSRPDQP